MRTILHLDEEQPAGAGITIQQKQNEVRLTLGEAATLYRDLRTLLTLMKPTDGIVHHGAQSPGKPERKRGNDSRGNMV